MENQELMSEEEYQELLQKIDAMPAPDVDWNVQDEKLRRRIAVYESSR